MSSKAPNRALYNPSTLLGVRERVPRAISADQTRHSTSRQHLCHSQHPGTSQSAAWSPQPLSVPRSCPSPPGTLCWGEMGTGMVPLPCRPLPSGPREPWPVVTSTPPCLPLLSLQDRISCSFGVLPPPKQLHCTWVGRPADVTSPWYLLWGTRGPTADFSATDAFLSLSGGEEGA